MLSQLPSWFGPAVAFCFGLIFGSFLNVCIYRLPLGRSVVSPGSACPNCGHEVRAYDNVPVLGWISLGGKCRDCQAPISWRYPAIELAVALFWLACAIHFPEPVATTKYCVLCFLLVGLIFTDIDHQILPDTMTITGTILGLAFAPWVWVQGLPGWMLTPHSWTQVRLISLLHAVFGAVVGAGLIFLVAEVYFRVRGYEGMGFGDVKLMALIGAFLGTRLALLTIFFGAISGSLTGLTILLLAYAKRRRRYRNSQRAWRSAQVLYSHFPLPFGVFLGAGALVSTFFGRQILDWYFSLY